MRLFLFFTLSFLIIFSSCKKEEIPTPIEPSKVQETYQSIKNILEINDGPFDFKNFKNILKNSIGGENQIVFCLQKDNFDIKIESDENFKINLNFLNKEFHLNQILKSNLRLELHRVLF